MITNEYLSNNFFSKTTTNVIEVCSLSKVRHYRGVPRIWQGGGQEIFFSDLEAMRFARGVRGHASPRKFFKMVQFAAFWCIF